MHTLYLLLSYSDFPGVKEMTRRFELMTNGNKQWNHIRLIHDATKQFKTNSFDMKLIKLDNIRYGINQNEINKYKK